MAQGDAAGANDLDERVDGLLARLRIEDKVGLLFHQMVSAGDLDGSGGFIPLTSAETLIAERRMTHFNVIGSTADARSFAEWHNALQRIASDAGHLVPITLSTDPRNHFSDNPMASMMAGAFSQWPEALGLAAIGSAELVEQFADTARQEYVAVGIRAALHPQIDLTTEPRWPRIAATFGEDAGLTSRLVEAYVRGFQGDRIGPTSVATMTKHFPGGGPQLDGEDPHFAWGREQVYPAGQFAYHLQPFKAALAAGTAQIMPYYGMPVGLDVEEVGFAYNRAIITTLLREELGFDGVVCTDWGLVTEKPDLREMGTARAWGVEHLSIPDRIVRLLDAGVDQLGGEECTDVLLALVQEGRVSEERIDESARRLLRLKVQLGLVDQPLVDVDAAEAVVGRPDFVAAGRVAQQRSVTLLTNATAAADASTLPLADAVRVYAEGFTRDALGQRATIVDSPADADVAVLRLKTPWTPSGRGGFADMFHGGSLAYPDDEVARITAICEAVPTVLDIALERPAIVTPFVEVAASIVVDYGIEEEALVDVLFGDVAPEGNLPFDLPASMDAVIASDSDAPFDTKDPAFRFGHGLRYA